MPKAAIPRRILFVLLIVALFATGAFLSQKGESQRAGQDPQEEPKKRPERPDADLWEKWKGKPMAEILATLAPSTAATNPTPLDPAPDPAGVEIDPYLPRFEPVAGLDLPPAEDATALYGHLILSASGMPLSVWRIAEDRAENVTATSGLDGIPGGKRCLAADFDRDGDLDLFIGRSGQAPDSLLRRTGEKTFEDVTESFGLLEFLDFSDATWVDYDRDGWLDLCLLQKTEATPLIRLFHNQGGNSFADAAAASGLGGPFSADALLWRDFDDDGYPDLILTGEKPRAFHSLAGETPGTRRFEDITAQSGLPDSPCGPMTAADFDGDGLSDLAIATDGGVSILLGKAGGAPQFARTDLKGVSAPTAIIASDFDLDGIPDLVVSGTKSETLAWWNAGEAEFREIPGSAGLSATAPLLRFATFDPADLGSPGIVHCGGGQTLSSFRKAESKLAEGRARIALRLHAPDTANRNALGARVTVSIRDRKFVYSSRTIIVGSPTEIIGLGEAAAIEFIEILWPDRERTSTRLGPQPVDSLFETGADPASVRLTPLDP